MGAIEKREEQDVKRAGVELGELRERMMALLRQNVALRCQDPDSQRPLLSRLAGPETPNLFSQGGGGRGSQATGEAREARHTRRRWTAWC